MEGARRIDGGGVTLAFAALGHGPALIHAGAALPAGADLDALAAALAVGRSENRPDDAADLLTVLPQAGWGFGGAPAVVLDRPTHFEPCGWSADGACARFTFRDAALDLALISTWRFLPSGLLAIDAELVSEGDHEIGVVWLAAMAMPLPRWASELHALSGRWADEFRLDVVPLAPGRVEKENRGGRAGFSGAAYAMVAEPGVREERGRVIAAHLAWSGDTRQLIETLPSGERQLQLGERLDPGEVTIPPGGRHRTPTALVALSEAGRNGIRRRFHAESRRIAHATGPRRVHFNSWEAVYFSLAEPTLLEIAEEAAALGVERFVLDDGWFTGRRGDHAALGDWTVDAGIFPAGLAPLIARVRALGMDFGLWVEPEMVSPDSALYREHPDWVLALPGRPRPTQRHQLVLDLSRAEVRDHLFAALDRLLRNHSISYLKWDHNRDLFPGGGRQQVEGVHTLMDRVREAHPGVEIETCASGGGRTDFAMMARAARIWVSDNTDPVERLRLHRAIGLFHPPEVIGAHVGASPNPITGRRTDMAFRARVAMFAHMGVEADPRALTPGEREVLAGHIGLYRAWRDLIHGGEQRAIDCDDGRAVAQIVISAKRDQAVALLARIDQAASALAAPVRLPGLDPAARYRVTLPEPWPARAARHLADAAWWRAGPVISGAMLAEAGLRLPLTHPETAWLVHLERVVD